jgi:hypothetical protein
MLDLSDGQVKRYCVRCGRSTERRHIAAVPRHRHARPVFAASTVIAAGAVIALAVGPRVNANKSELSVRIAAARPASAERPDRKHWTSQVAAEVLRSEQPVDTH